MTTQELRGYLLGSGFKVIDTGLHPPASLGKILSRIYISSKRFPKIHLFLINLFGIIFYWNAARILPDALLEKSWSTDGLSNQWVNMGHELVSYFRERPEHLERYRKVGQYLATKTLIMHIRHRDLASFVGDARRFYSIGLLNEGIVHLLRNHLQVKTYRREAAKQESLAALVGPPSDWTSSNSR